VTYVAEVPIVLI